ncbi:MAG: Triosephosphate isomerase [Candidatus Magasanikbacteria bacterium GW2011_GWC2_37_14]|uniref:Triosephosphate isomerase n=1 Tax=Candidatus Magasanikbacteria bacterium GW2011_GWC2_37_14 TaxID=1619046 RepID=A0A0G0G9E5_9BACT|nr:MAG: Triosephosphate isomerase [Candidatus Magasanikbacteria bacterium GW2011_GWC2_37_14]
MKYLFGNWKMYLDYNESINLSKQLAEVNLPSKNKIVVFPSNLAFKAVQENLASTQIATGPQNVAWVPKGGYTGEVSAHMFKDLGATYALIGHSERRHVFGETDDEVRKKVEACLDAGLIPVVCIGETKEELSEGKREYRLKKQIMKVFENLDLSGKEIIVAYEPVWAIGTGTPCLPADADDIHGWVKNELKQYTNQEIPVLYGASVNAENVLSFLSLSTIDGILAGGASVKFNDWQEIVKKAEEI